MKSEIAIGSHMNVSGINRTCHHCGHWYGTAHAFSENVVECGRALSKHMRVAMIQQEWTGSNDPAPVMRLSQGTAASRHGVGAISDSVPCRLGNGERTEIARRSLGGRS